jgi:hypothetical protein
MNRTVQIVHDKKQSNHASLYLFILRHAQYFFFFFFLSKSTTHSMLGVLAFTSESHGVCSKISNFHL